MARKLAFDVRFCNVDVADWVAITAQFPSVTQQSQMTMTPSRCYHLHTPLWGWFQLVASVLDGSRRYGHGATFAEGRCGSQSDARHS